MTQATLTIHLHEATERDEQGLKILEEIVDKNHAVALAFGVDNVEAWQQKRRFYGHVKYLVGAQNVSLVQRGYRNRCLNEHTIRDPHHENKCSTLLNGRVDAGSQRKDIWLGKTRIEFSMGKEPVAYCPPNSLYDEMTVGMAKDLGYTHFTVPSVLPAFPYKPKDRIIIVPQTALARYGVGRHAYAHLDQLPELGRNGKLKQHLEQGLMPLTAVEKEPWVGYQVLNQTFLLPANRVLHYGYIQMRDARRAIQRYLKKLA